MGRKQRDYQEAVREINKEQARLTFAGCFWVFLIILIVTAVLTLVVL